MANTTLKVRNRIATKTTAEWETENPILLKGEMGYDSTSKRYKIGDGVKKWKNLQYEIDTGILSSGQQLVVNGNGILGDNTNFSQLVYDPTMSFNGSPGVFRLSINDNYKKFNNDLFIPKRGIEPLRVPYWVKRNYHQVPNTLPLFGLICWHS